VPVADWPLIPAGPIVRRVEPRLACVWVAVKASCTVRLEVWSGIQPGSTGTEPLAQVNRHTLRVGDNLHIGLPTIELPISVAPFLPGQIYSYNLTLTPDDGTPQQTFASLGLLQDRAGVEQNEQLTVKPHLALGALMSRHAQPKSFTTEVGPLFRDALRRRLAPPADGATDPSSRRRTGCATSTSIRATEP
jgi:hypothetical protein